MITVSQLVVEVTANTNPVESAMPMVSEMLHKAGGALGDALTGVANFGAGAAGIAIEGVKALADGMGDIISKGMEAEHAQTRLAAAINATGSITGVTVDQANKLTDALIRKIPVDDQVIQGSEAIIARYTNISKEVFPNAEMAALDVSAALGIGLTSATKTVAKALDDPIKGLTQLHRLGVDFTADQIAQVKAMEKAGDIAGAQAIILGELEKHYHGAAEAAGHDLNGKLEILNTQFDNMKQNIGLAVIPALSGMLDKVMPLVFAFGDALPGALDKVGQVTGPVFTAFMALASSAIPEIARGINDSLPILMQMGVILGLVLGNALRFGQGIERDILPIALALAKIIGTTVIPEIVLLSQWFGDRILPIIMALVAGLLAQLHPALVAIGKALNDSQPFIKQLMEAFNQLLPVIEVIAAFLATTLAIGIGVAIGAIQGIIHALAGLIQAFTGAAQLIAGIWDIIQGIFTLNGDKIKQGLGLLGEGVKNIFVGMISAVLGFVAGFATGLFSWFDTITGGGLTKIGNFMAGIVRWFHDMPSNVETELNNFDSMVSNFFEGLIAKALDWGANLMNQLAAGISQAGANVGNAIHSGLNQAVHNVPVIGGLIPQFAVGTDFAPGGPAILGERGPEIVDLPRGTKVYDNQQTRGILSSGSPGVSGPVTITIMLDSRTIGKKIMPHIVQNIRVATGLNQ